MKNEHEEPIVKDYSKEDLVIGKERFGVEHPLESLQVDKALRNMIDSEIKNVGFIKGELEGGLTFDYNKDGNIFRLVLGYNELGEWVIYHGSRK